MTMAKVKTANPVDYSQTPRKKVIPKLEQKDLENGLFLHSSPPKVLSGGSNSWNIREYIRKGDIDALEEVLLSGQGNVLVNQPATNKSVRGFLRSVPSNLSKIDLIHDAAEKGNLRDLKSLLDRRKFARSKDSQGVGILHKAVLNGQKDVVKYLVENYPETLEVTDPELMKKRGMCLHKQMSKGNSEFQHDTCNIVCLEYSLPARATSRNDGRLTSHPPAIGLGRGISDVHFCLQESSFSPNELLMSLDASQVVSSCSIPSHDEDGQSSFLCFCTCGQHRKLQKILSSLEEACKFSTSLGLPYQPVDVAVWTTPKGGPPNSLADPAHDTSIDINKIVKPSNVKDLQVSQRKLSSANSLSRVSTKVDLRRDASLELEFADWSNKNSCCQNEIPEIFPFTVSEDLLNSSNKTFTRFPALVPKADQKVPQEVNDFYDNLILSSLNSRPCSVVKITKHSPFKGMISNIPDECCASDHSQCSRRSLSSAPIKAAVGTTGRSRSLSDRTARLPAIPNIASAKNKEGRSDASRPNTTDHSFSPPSAGKITAKRSLLLSEKVLASRNTTLNEDSRSQNMESNISKSPLLDGIGSLQGHREEKQFSMSSSTDHHSDSFFKAKKNVSTASSMHTASLAPKQEPILSQTSALSLVRTSNQIIRQTLLTSKSIDKNSSLKQNIGPEQNPELRAVSGRCRVEPTTQREIKQPGCKECKNGENLELNCCQKHKSSYELPVSAPLLKDVNGSFFCISESQTAPGVTVPHPTLNPVNISPFPERKPPLPPDCDCYEVMYPYLTVTSFMKLPLKLQSYVEQLTNRIMAEVGAEVNKVYKRMVTRETERCQLTSLIYEHDLTFWSNKIVKNILNSIEEPTNSEANSDPSSSGQT